MRRKIDAKEEGESMTDTSKLGETPTKVRIWHWSQALFSFDNGILQEMLHHSSARTDMSPRVVLYDDYRSLERQRDELAEKNAELNLDAQRYAELKINPVGGAHLLELLASGKGTEKSLDKMLDRIRNSRLAAIQKGIDDAKIEGEPK